MADAGRCPDLEWRFNDAEIEIKRIGSVQSSFEAEMEARSRQARHLPNVILERDPVSGQVRRHVYGGLVCGQVFVGGGTHSSSSPKEPDRRALSASDRARRIDAAIELADRLHPGTREILELRFGAPMKVLDPASDDRVIVRGIFGVAGGQRSETTGIRRALLRGNGSVAHLTDAAREAFERSRTARESCSEWVDWLGTKLARNGGSAAERTLAATIARESDTLVVVAIARFRACLCRVPERVLRGARARLEQPAIAA